MRVFTLTVPVFALAFYLLIPLPVYSQQQKLPPPEILPNSDSFLFEEYVTITYYIPGVTIYYRLNNGNYQVYTGQNIRIIETTTVQAYAVNEGWEDSDTLTETYTMLAGASQLNLERRDGTPIAYLTENDNTFIIEILAPYAALTAVATGIITINGGDSEVFTIYNPQLISGQALVFTDTVTFAVGSVTPSNSVLQSSAYDTIRVSWTNPLNASDVVNGSIVVRPAPRQSSIYFTDAAGNPKSELTGREDSVHIVVEDQIFDPSRTDYTVSVKNILGAGNLGPADIDTFPLAAMSTPGRYQARVPLSLASAIPGDGTLQARIGDQIQATYTDPIDGDQANAQTGLGIPVEQPSALAFTNAGYTLPLELSDGYWDANKGSVYLVYTDDSIDVVTSKSITLSVSIITAMGTVLADQETFSMANQTVASGGVGTWVIAIPLVEDSAIAPGNGSLEFYGKGTITAVVQSHKNANTEQLDGGTASATLSVKFPGTVKMIDFNTPFNNRMRYTVDSENSLTIDVPLFASDMSLFIYRSNGTLLKSFSSLQDSRIKINTAGWESGVYCIKVVIDGKSVVNKLVL